MNLPEQENKLEAYGTVITSDGLLVAALSTIDQSRLISGREITTRTGSRIKLDATVDIKEVRILLPDGEEVPADVIFKDTDLDLAFIRARADSKQFKSAKFIPVDLKNSAKAVIAEETITLMRADDVLNRQPSVARGQVTVLVTKPREFVRATSAAPGTPTFNTDGKLLGIGTVRIVQGKQPTVVLIPASEVVELSEQAKTAKAKPVVKEEKKPEKTEKPETSDKAEKTESK
jgi:S1-C subfamily serine protease